MASHINVTRRPTYNNERLVAWEGMDKVQGYKGNVSYGECTMLTTILNQSTEKGVIPAACRYDEANNYGRVHRENNDHGLYNFSRRITRGAGVAVDHGKNVHFNDAKQSGDISMGECHTLAKHLHETFGVLHLLPRSCGAMLEKAKGSS